MNQLDSDKVVALITQILAEDGKVSTEPLAPDTSLSAHGIDSLAVILILASLEERLNIEWETEDFNPAKYQTVGALAGFIAQKQGQS